MEKLNKLLLVDGNSILNRAFYATFAVGNLMRSPENIPTNGIFGFLNIFLKVVNDEKPTNIIIAFDKGGKTKRHELFSEYKAGRHKMPEELRVQFPILKEIIQKMKIPIVEFESIEADDILGTISKNSNMDTCILTGDRDYFQLIDEKIYIRYPKSSLGHTTDIKYDVQKIYEEYGLKPSDLIELKALMGDKSDNIPGIAGIGEKTAISLVKEYGSVENLLEKISKSEDNLTLKQREKIQNGKEFAILSKKLGRINTFEENTMNVLISTIKNSFVDIQNFLDNDEIYKIFKKLAFNSLLRRIKFSNVNTLENLAENPKEGLNVENIKKLSYEQSKKEYDKLYRDAKKSQELSLFLYTREYDRKNLELDIRYEIYKLLSEENINSKYMETFNKINTIAKVDSIFANVYEPKFNKDKTYIFKVEDILELLKDEKIKKIMFSCKNDMVNFFEKNIHFNNIFFDTKVGEYVKTSQNLTNSFYAIFNKYFDPNLIGLNISEDFNNLEKINNIKELIKTENKEILKLKPYFEKYIKKNISKEEFLENAKSTIDVIKNIAIEDENVKENILENGSILSKLNYDIYIKQNKEIEENNQMELARIEMDLIEVLASMQYNGISIDKDELEKYGKELKQKQENIEEKIYKIVGKFNISSPKQLGEVLFEKLNLKAKSKNKSKTGYSTSIEVLESIKDSHEIIPLVLEYRKTSKVYSTYIEGLIEYINPKTNKIHSIFHQNITATGRISSSDPNLQNIPARTEMGKEIRKSFIGSNNNYLVDADYSQIELRVMADISEENALIEAFKRSEDIHKLTASTMFHVPLEEVDQNLRQKAKAINFGIIYGISNFGLSQNAKISVSEAKEYIDKYFEEFPKIKEYMERIVAEAKEKGYVVTKLNRRRYFKEINSSNFLIREAEKRAAMNAPVQGSAADITKIAMNKVYKRLKEEKLRSKLILQIHDELIIDTFEDELEEVKKIIQEEMENAYTLKVPLKVEVEAQKSWYDCK